MKKSVHYLLVSMLTLAVVLSAAGCASKDTSTAGASSSPSSSSPSDAQGVKPTVKPSGSAAPSSEPPDDDGAEISSDPTAGVSSKPGSAGNSGKDYSSLGAALLENDGLGLLALRLSEEDLLYLLGEPEEKSEPEVWGSDGLSHSSWSYPSKGLEIGMAQLPDDTEAHVFSITAMAPCDLATKRGIKIGSAKDDVLAAYKNEIDPSANDDTDSWITAGSVYGGIGFGIENGAVTYIFIGASAE